MYVELRSEEKKSSINRWKLDFQTVHDVYDDIFVLS